MKGYPIYPTSVLPDTPAFGVKLFDACRISTKKLVLTLLILWSKLPLALQISLDFSLTPESSFRLGISDQLLALLL